MSSRAADEAASTTTEAAATTADSSGRAAAQDAASRSGGEEPAESQKSESCLAGGRSFSAGTKVLTASGALVAISKLKPGDKVVATNTKTGKTQAEPVAAVLVHYDKDLYDLTVGTAGATSVIRTTRSHLFWNQTTGRWTKAAALQHGTHLRTPSDGSLTVLGGRTPQVTTGWMWDLTISGNNDHDFYVGNAATAVLVHNCGAARFSVDSNGEATDLQKGEITDLPEGSAEAGKTTYWAEDRAEKRQEEDDLNSGLGDAGQFGGEMFDSFRGVPPSDWVTESPVSAKGPEMGTPGVPQGGVEPVAMNTAILARVAWLIIRSLRGGRE